MTDDARDMSLRDRLVVGAAVAPTLRRATRGRRVAVVDVEGNVVGYRELGDVQKAILQRAKIELDVGDGVRPKVIFCDRCGVRVRVGPKGPIPSQCKEHRDGGGTSPKCGGCGARMRHDNALCMACWAGCLSCGKRMANSVGWAARRDGKRRQCAACQRADIVKAACADCGGGVSLNRNTQFRKDGRPVRCRPCSVARGKALPRDCRECGGRVGSATASVARKAGRLPRCLACYRKAKATQ